MNAERLLDAFNRLGDEPETIQQFRKLVVGLAMSGKLVAPDEAAMDPSSFLKQLEAKNRILVQQGALRKQGPLAALSLEALPKGFTNLSNFVRLGEIARIEKGQTGIMKAQPGAYPLVVTAEERGTCVHFDFDGAAAIVPLVSSAGHGKASLQRLHYQEGKFALGSILAAIFPHAPELISARFLFEYLTSFKDELLISQMIGTANVSLSVGKVSDVPVPLVPPSVQRNVDELMGLCDRLEAARAGREAVRNRLTAASLARLNAPNPETFQEDARFALDALPSLATRPDQIKQIRQTILNLAVRGKLVSRAPNDEPASALLKRIGADAIARKSDAEHELPTCWAWALIEDCFVISGGMQKTPARTPKTNAFPYLGVGNVYRGRLDLANVKKFELAAGELERFRLEPQDILVVEGNGSANEIGRCAVWNGEIENCVHQNHIIRCRPKSPQLTPYAALYLNSPDGMAEMKRLAITSAGLFSLSVSKIRKIPFPLPSLAEQHRIVAKVDELMGLCDQLEGSLTATAATRRRLLDALLAEALVPADDRELEAAE